MLAWAPKTVHLDKNHCACAKNFVQTAMRMLVSWIGNADLRAPSVEDKSDIGPVAQALEARKFDRVLLLADQEKAALRKYEGWLRAQVVGKARVKLTFEYVELTSPTNFDEIYTAVTQTLEKCIREIGEQPELTFHLSPGTPAMAAIWVILGKTRYKAELIQSSRQKGVETASVPFDIALSPEFVTDVLRAPDKRLEGLSTGSAEDALQFGGIIYRGVAMERLIARAQKAAPRSVPVLIEGESGTGKELLARAIHQTSTRRDKAFQIVNCGAIPAELVESELFGHVKGAFTSATKDHIGHFEAANGGTLFLDEIGELPLAAQVKLLRAIQEGEIRRVGDIKTVHVDVRIIAATNRELSAEAALGRFREDLFYRLAVLVLKVPPLRERDSDLGLLIDGLLARINDQSERANEPGFKRKKISGNARNLLMQQHWPGNIRELENTLRRAAVWSSGETISADDIKEALLPVIGGKLGAEIVLNRSLDQGIDIQHLIGSVAEHYLRRAMDAAHGNKTKAAKLLGLANYQTLSNWLEKYGIS
jgi:transcriptional regulator with GAF, ATPase, and Fis domain